MCTQVENTENTNRFTLSKQERVYKRNIIKLLFEKGNSFLIYPFRVIWIDTETDTNYPAQFGVSVSKKRYKSAVKRNRIKRLTREGFRLHKHILYSSLSNNSLKRVFMLIYVGKNILPFQLIESKIILILQRLSLINEKTIK